ncbi:MAG TPA: flagellar motor switch protein FliG [Candidatus Sulfotelmatobacter sp.]|nr:flagellar motor switch protein FliG [Candidatus Sulfotelmatobacter sp.]
MKEEIVLAGKRKAAILLVLLGDEVAATVYKHLPDNELRQVTQEIAELEYISPEVATKVLREYHRLALTQEYLAQGGQEYARKLLVKAFGEQGAKELLEEVDRAQEASAQNLDTLQKADPQQLAKFIQGEHPQTIALILAHLNSKVARTVLMLLPEKIRSQAVKRLAQMQQFSPEMVKKIALVLNKRLLTLGAQSQRAYGGVKTVAELLNQIDQDATAAILETIEQDNAQLATTIRNLMFTFEDFLEVPDAGIRELLAQVDKKSLAMALKGASEDLKNHIFKCMSSRAVEMLKEDMDVLGPIRSKEVRTAQTEIVNIARRLEGEGKLTLKQEQEDSYVV